MTTHPSGGRQAEPSPLPLNSPQPASVPLAPPEREALIAEALLAAGTGTWYVHLASGEARWDEITQRIFGLPAGLLHGRFETFLDLVHPDDVLDALAAIDRARETRTTYIGSYRIRLPPPDGGERWIASRGRFFYDEAGRPVRAAGTLTDVTDRVKAARERKAHEVLLASLLNEMPAIVVAADDRGRIRVWNREAERVLGWTGDEMARVDDPLARLLPDTAYRQTIRAELARAGEHPGGMEVRVINKNGNERMLAFWSVSRDLKVPGFGHWGLAIDITERKRSELALRQSEERFRTLSEDAPLGIFQLDGDGRVSYANSYALVMAGLDPAAAIGDGWRLSLHPDDGERLLQEVRAFHESTGRSFSIDFRFRQPSGRVVWVHGRAGRLLSEDGSRRGYIGTLEDISAQVEAERERERFEEQLRQAQKLESLGVLAGGIAHDMNNLLVPILGNASLARGEAPPGSELQQTISDIELAAQRAAELTRQLLAYSGKGRFVVQPLDLSAVAREMVALMQASIPKLATLRIELADDLRPIQGDATQLRQVIMNLLTNAADALEGQAGVIRVATGVMEADPSELSTMYLADELPEGECVYVEVSDTGCGMTPDTMRRIFDPFFTTKFTGRGLGLAATLGILRGHRGAVRVQSDPGGGSTFRVLFPASDGPRIEEARAVAPTDPWRAEGTILIVDDEPPVRAVATRIARRVGLEVVEAVDGQQALELFEKHQERISLVLLDLSMPVMGGEEVAAALARVAPDVRIVLTSGFTDHDLRARIGSDGIVAFVGKPFVSQELIAAFRAALGGRDDESR